jgi:uncharacterized protein YecE (DUF72 family)
MKVRVGTSGWQYPDWRPAFYPPKLAATRWLEFFAGHFATVESNSAFYHLPAAATFAAWATRTPPDFVMAVKVSRYLTHILRLTAPEEPVRRFLERVRHLGPTLGPLLLQLPPTLEADLGRLEETRCQFPRDVRVAVEFRHDSWFTPQVRRLLESRHAALCLADRRGPITPAWVTADWTYLRFHFRAGLAAAVLRTRGSRRLGASPRRAGGGVGRNLRLLNNDHRCCAVRNAVEFAHACESAGLDPTRVPPLDAVTVVGA